MHYQNDISGMSGFISELKGGSAAPTPGPPATATGPLMSAAAAASVPSLRHPRSEHNGFMPPFPAFSGALSSSAGGAGPVSRTFSVLRNATGEASLGSFNNTIHHMPSSLSADPPVHPQPAPPRGPPSPIPHLHHSSFANTSSFHPLTSFTHLNHSPNSVPRQSLNFSPHPPPTSSAPAVATQPPSQLPSHADQPQNATSQNISPSTVASQRHSTAPPYSQQTSRPTHMSQATHAPMAPPYSQRPIETSAPKASNVMLRGAPKPFRPGYGVSQPGVQPTGTGYARHEMGMNGSQGVSSAAGSVVTTLPMSSDGHSQIIEGRRRESETPAKRARTVDRPSQLSPTPQRSTAGGGAWSGQTGYSGKGRESGDGHSSVPSEEQSRPERKREREKRRRETMNTRFNELAACLVISAGGKSDKESILAEAVEHVKKQKAKIEELSKQNGELLSEARDLRAEKSELRQDKNYLREERDQCKEELEALKSQLGIKRQKTGVKEEDATSTFVKREEVNGRKAEVQG